MRTLGIVLVIIGVILLIFGALFTFVTFGFGILCVWPLLLVGLILLIIGAVLSVERGPVQQQPIVIQQQPQQQSQGGRFCPGCGRSIPFDAQFCSYCGKKF